MLPTCGKGTTHLPDGCLCESAGEACQTVLTIVQSLESIVYSAGDYYFKKSIT